MTEAAYEDDLALIHTPDQIEFPLYGLDLAAGSIDLHVNANKTEYPCFKQNGATRFVDFQASADRFGCLNSNKRNENFVQSAWLEYNENDDKDDFYSDISKFYN